MYILSFLFQKHTTLNKDLAESEIRWNKKDGIFPYSVLLTFSDVLLNGIKVRVFYRKNIEKKHLCRHDKDFYYFWKSNIPLINLIVDSRYMIKVSKNMRL